MAIFSKNDRIADEDFSSKGMTTISQGTTLVGNINIQCNLHIDGKINGDITSSASVTIGTHGEVEGKIIASKVIISGIFKGNLDAESIELLSNSIVAGDIVSDRLIMEDGANFEGSTKRRKKNTEYLGMGDDLEEPAMEEVK